MFILIYLTGFVLLGFLVLSRVYYYWTVYFNITGPSFISNKRILFYYWYFITIIVSSSYKLCYITFTSTPFLQICSKKVYFYWSEKKKK